MCKNVFVGLFSKKIDLLSIGFSHFSVFCGLNISGPYSLTNFCCGKCFLSVVCDGSYSFRFLSAHRLLIHLLKVTSRKDCLKQRSE